MRISSFPRSSVLIDLVPLLKIIWSHIQGFISGLSILLHWFSCLSSCHCHTYDHCSFVVNFKSKCELYKFVLFRMVLAIHCPLSFHMNSRTDSSMFAKKKKSRISKWRIALNMQINLGDTDILINLSVYENMSCLSIVLCLL